MRRCSRAASRTEAFKPRALAATAPLQAAFGEQKVKFIDARLNAQTALLAQGASVVCAFVNDSCDAEVCAALAQQGVKLIAMRCAGFDRVDVAAAAQHGITVVRVPSYSPHAVRTALLHLRGRMR